MKMVQFSFKSLKEKNEYVHYYINVVIKYNLYLVIFYFLKI